MTEYVIPDLVAERVLGNRSRFVALNNRAQEAQRDASANSPKYGFVTKPLELDAESQFWLIEDNEELEDFLFEDLLTGLYGQMTEVEWRSLPAGYAPLVAVLEFERHCLFEGWTAIRNKGDEEMPFIIRSYRTIGLPEEADALQKVFELASAYSGDEDEEFHERMGRAYKSVPNRYRETELRVPLIIEFVRNNPGLFGVANEA